MRYEIHPSVGVARLGNSPTAFYLAPDGLGTLPVECTSDGDPESGAGGPRPVSSFKDPAGRVKRQAALFRVFAYDDGQDGARGAGREVRLDSEVAAVEWTVHLANKKAAWYQFAELQGDLMLGPQNSYERQGVTLRNAAVGGDARRKLIIDPGPRTVRGPRQRAEFSRGTVPADYRWGSFPDEPTQGTRIDTLGELRTDSTGRLLVLGGFGNAGGSDAITSFGGADSWHDDIADGPVLCRLTLRDGTRVELRAWVIVGSPKFAPELVNFVTLDDVMFDVGVRYLGAAPHMYDAGRWADSGGWNPEYPANFDRDIAPIIQRPKGYQWVAAVPSMIAFAAPPFDPRDASAAVAPKRRTYFSYFRRPGRSELDGQQNVLLSAGGLPLMPVNSGSNSVTNVLVDKFLTLTRTQYFLLGQWAEGKFRAAVDDVPFDPRDRASVGNCVGSPMCPGIEVTWSLRHPAIYEGPYRIRHRADADYAKAGLSPSRDECEGGGCEPGDLTKRMAIPWQADFFQCTVQFINFTDPTANKEGGIPVPPTYYAYWWPPQSPMSVMTGVMDAREQAIAGVPSGSQVYYARGVNSFAQMIAAWSYLGFVVNRNVGPDGADYPSFEESERNHAAFAAAAVAVGSVDNYINNTDQFFLPVWFLREEPTEGPAALALAAAPPGARHPIRSVSLPRMRRGRGD